MRRKQGAHGQQRCNEQPNASSLPSHSSTQGGNLHSLIVGRLVPTTKDWATDASLLRPEAALQGNALFEAL